MDMRQVLILPCALLTAPASVSAQIEPEWVGRYEDRADGRLNLGQSVAADAEGNAWVLVNDRPPEIVKYAPDGAEIWSRPFDGGADVEAAALGLDATGNVYVTGTSSGHFVTAKYDREGNEAWVRRYEGPRSHGRSIALAVDLSGNVCVSGPSLGSRRTEYATVKYAPDGVELWVARYDGGGAVNQPLALAADFTGNFYVAGFVDSGGAIAMIKYGPSGTLEWVARLDETQPGPENVSMQADGLGNLFTALHSPLGYVLVKLDANGNRLWIARQETDWVPGSVRGALVLDQDGNAFVTSSLGTARIDPFGSQVWFAEQGGVGIDLDPGGSVYLTTRSSGDYTTFNLDPGDGSIVWVAVDDHPQGGDDAPMDLSVDATGAVWVTGWSAGDCRTVKYSGGARLFSRIHDGPERESQNTARDLVLDATGCVYITGCSGEDSATVKYDPDGNELWVARQRGSHANSLAVGPEGNIHVAASQQIWIVPGDPYVAFNVEDRLLTAKYNADGAHLWAAHHDVCAEGDEDCVGAAITKTAMALDGAGNVLMHAAVEIWGGAGSATAKYDPSGTGVWSSMEEWRWLDDAGPSLASMAVESDGSLYLASALGRVERRDRNGMTVWSRRMDRTCIGFSGCGASDPALAIDSQGNLCAAFESGSQFATAKFTPEGDLLWVREDGGAAVALDESDNVYVTGSSGTRKYDSEGNEVWTHLEGGVDIALDRDENVYVVKTDSGDIRTLALSSNGRLLWNARYNGGGDGEAVGLAVDEAGHVYVGGTSSGAYVTIKYAPESSGPRFRRGDCNDDGRVDISDAISSLASLFLGQEGPGCDDACDSNDDGVFDISDAVATLGVLFLGQGPMPLPGMSACGIDPTEDEIGCRTFGQCP